MISTIDYCTAADGARLGYQCVGEGKGPPMLLIAGLAGEAKFWRPVIDDLASRHNVIVFDQRGFGASGTTDSICTIDLLAADALAIMDAAGVEQAIVAAIRPAAPLPRRLRSTIRRGYRGSCSARPGRRPMPICSICSHYERSEERRVGKEWRS